MRKLKKNILQKLMSALPKNYQKLCLETKNSLKKQFLKKISTEKAKKSCDYPKVAWVGAGYQKG